MKFRSRVVVIDAWRFPGRINLQATEFRAMPEWLKIISGGAETIANIRPGQVVAVGNQLHVATLEGVMIASPGDWIIRGTEGELYPCKPSVFERKYEPAE